MTNSKGIGRQPMAAEIKRLSQEHYWLILDLELGADISGYAEASMCRDIQRLKPQYISIVKRKFSYTATDKLPYFGAVATPAGVKAAKAAIRRGVA